MEKKSIPVEIPKDIESQAEIEEVVIEDVLDEDLSTEPPDGFEDLLYEAWKEKQLFKNGKPDPDKNAVAV